MSLGHGRHYLAIPGPSVMPDRVLQAMHQPAPNIYDGDLIDMVPGLIDDLKAVARTEAHATIYITNGHGAWEATLANVCSRGDTVLVLVTGAFGFGWANAASGMGINAEIMDFGRDAPAEPARVTERLREDTGGKIKAVLVCQTDTATSIRNNIKEIRGAIDVAEHPALLMADCMASLGCDRFEMDAWGVDVMTTGSQKGLMTPPGMAFVFYNARADAARETANCVTPYWDWRPRTNPEIFYHYFCGTAPTHHLFGLRAALDMINGEGLDAVWTRHEVLSHAIWAAIKAWGQAGALRLNVADPAYRSRSVTTVHAADGAGTALRNWVESQAGVTLGIGLGMGTDADPNSDSVFRIGHMGHVNAQMVLGALGAIEAGLIATKTPIGTGALRAAAEVIAEPSRLSG